MDRRQIAAVLVLDELGVPLQLDSFDQRLIVQKALYLVQAVGLDLGYYYNWYLRGPYCSAVAQHLFSALDDLDEVAECQRRYKLDDGSRQRLRDLRTHVIPRSLEGEAEIDDASQARRLELLASVHFLVARNQVPEHDSKDISERLKAFNKDFTEQEVQEALDKLRTHGLLTNA